MSEEEKPNDASAEVEAVSAGYGPFYQGLQTDLETSPGTVEIDAAKDQYEANRTNYEMLAKFADLLPHSQQDRFRLGEQNLQYMYRQLQANVVWWNTMPYYLIGRKTSTEHQDSTDLLLLAAKDDVIEADRGLLMKLTVASDDLAARDAHVRQIENKELPQEEIQWLSEHGHISLSGYLHDDSVFIDNDKRLKGSYEQAHGQGTYIRRTGTAGAYGKAIEKEILESFQAYTEIARLANAFGVAEQLKSLMNGHAEVTEATPSDLTERLMDQNRDLKTAMSNMLIAAGLSKEEADKLISEKYPEL